jgi:arylsulfatase
MREKGLLFFRLLPLTLAGLALAWAPPAAAAADKPNVILVLTDDQGYADFSCHGNPIVKTPNCDRLHHESIRLTDFHVCPMCTPTRGQILTGRDCLRNGAMNVSSGRTPLRHGIPTMADIFAASGYRTGHFGKWHLGDNYPYRPQDRGFQKTVHCRSWGMASAADHWNNDCFDDTFWHNGKAEPVPGYNSDALFDLAMQWMKSSKEQPFLVYLPLTAAHGPLFVPDRYREPYRKLSLKPNVVSFYAMIANIDENMGRLDRMLQEERLADNTILIFMTDNGGTAGVQTYNAGMRAGKTTYYEGGHRVPCFIRWPAGKLRPPGDVVGLTQCQDVLPTLIDLCAIKQPEGASFDGVSLAPILRGSETMKVPDRILVVQYSRIPQPRPQKGDACVLWQRWRLVADKELYDLSVDPGQQKNVIDQHPLVVKRLRDHYDAWWAGVEKGLDEFQPIHVGSDFENPVRLSPCDWQDMHCDQSAQVRRGEKKNAPWNIQVEREGEYEISLLRWPREAGLPIRAGAPAYQGVDGPLPAGVPLPIARARLRLGDIDRDQPVKEGDRAITFLLHLKAGRAKLQTWFYDESGNELCGAYYTEVLRK